MRDQPSSVQPGARLRRAVDRAVEWAPPILGRRGTRTNGRLVLWDLRGGFSAWWRLDAAAHRRAFTIVVGRSPHRTPPAATGPDPLVAAEMMTANGVARTDIGRLLPRYLPAFAVALGELAGRNLDIAPRPTHLLRAIRDLADSPETFQSFVAWEIRPSLRIRFRSTGLDRYLDPELGACGSDHTDAAVLLRLARERVERRFQLVFDDQDVHLVRGSHPESLAEQQLGAVSGGER